MTPSARALAVPAFTPNVVDVNGQLQPEEKREINAAIERIRREAGIHAAVYLRDSLEGEPIEAVAERAFNTWLLGEKGKDNGLLLVLAMRDRKSRFEVGYGLEGDLPDVVAKRALDDVMKPLLREGKTKQAIIDAFEYLSAVRRKSPEVDRFVPPTPAVGWTSTGEPHWRRGLITYLIFFLALWLVVPLAGWRARALARELEERMPEYRRAEDPALQGQGAGRLANLGLRAFFTLNPGIFIFIGGAFVFWLFLTFPLLIATIAVAYYRKAVRRYRSPEAYRAFIAQERMVNAAMVAKGYKRETKPGYFEHTPAWFSSAEYREQQRRRASSSGGSSSSSSSSSSGGGRSGGGGASSSW